MEEYKQLFGKMESCAVHIHRDDYVNIHGCIDMTYYEKAMEMLREKKKDCLFIFFSD